MEKNKYEDLKRCSRLLITQIANCIEDDFKNYHESDIKNWFCCLNEIKKKSDLIKGDKE